MGDVPTIDTSTWRLPKKAHHAPEASFTDDMYRAKGLPVDPDRAPTTGGSGLPTVDTEDWVTPSTRRRLEEERGTLDPDDFDGQELSERKPRGVGRKRGLPSTFSKSERKGKGRGPSSPSGSANRWERRGEKKEIEAQMRGEEAETDDDLGFSAFAEACGSSHGGKSILKRKGAKATPPAPAMEDIEDVRSVQRRLAGLEKSRHLEFATGTPYRRMPNTSRAVSLVETELDPAPGEKAASKLSEEQRVLSGITGRAPLPHPMGDTRPVGSGPAHGILDDGMDGGEAFVEKVLQESRWFFRDFGDLALGAKKRPFDEAPGGRAEPWRGSHDEPAATPVVRQGKVKGVVGGEVEPEEDEEEQGEKQPAPGKKPVPPTKKSKAKAPPEEEPEEGEEEKTEAEQTRAGTGLRHAGSRLRALGQRMRSGTAAQKAKEGLHQRLQKFVKKHGIKAMGNEPDEPSKPKTTKPKRSSIRKPKPPTIRKPKK